MLCCDGWTTLPRVGGGRRRIGAELAQRWRSNGDQRWRAACVDPHSPTLLLFCRIIFTPTPGVRPPAIAMAFFESDIVQDEAKRLFGDYQQLMQLGSEYGKFDREGKKLYIERMEEMMDRYRVFMKRFELSEDFQAKLTVEQLRTQLGQFGLTPETMFQQMHQTLERMKGQVEQES
jgi:hypothetical protein